MRHTDIAIVGGGLAGSIAAVMLGRSKIACVLVDPTLTYPKDFRCEKLDETHIGLLVKTGLAEPVLKAATVDRELWIARFGRLVDKRPSGQADILYHDLVNAIRAEIPDSTAFIEAKVSSITTSADRQSLTLSDGEEISARLVILATGLNNGLRASLGIERIDVSKCHSVTIGFDMKPVGRPHFDFRALTYYGGRPADDIAYLSLFPIGSVTRANFFVYRDMRDPWLKTLREAPEKTLLAAMPRLKRLTGEFAVAGEIAVRPVDLYVTKGYRKAGIVLAGDAFATSCPAAGTGTSKVLTDVERLCNLYIPRWLATDGMGQEKIAAFYDDPTKKACDAWSSARAYFLRSISTDETFSWTLRRWFRFTAQLGLGVMRHWLSQLPFVARARANRDELSEIT